MNVRFFIIGGAVFKAQGSQFTIEELRELAAQNGVSDCLGFIPFQNDPVPIYRALSIVVNASTQPEPFGRTIVEAMACGRPVIAAIAGGATEVFTDQFDALGFTPGNGDELAACIIRLCSHPDLRAKLGQNGRITVESKFNCSRLGSQLMELYGSLI